MQCPAVVNTELWHTLPHLDSSSAQVPQIIEALFSYL